ncbi:hypothetical protein A3197_17205 [Candidatus Thiodiazotropha endoloripes]|nr:hypothetical protein A3197_17205 [Candidatus Thiodiazotropha endoloripes]
MDYHVAWYNLENLFDTVRSNNRPDWLQKKLNKELKGWTAPVLDKKLNQLSTVINGMNQGAGPDILGVCEIENDDVLSKLITKLHLQRNYAVAHHDMSDKRGIDVAFIYDQDLLSVTHQFSRVILKRNATRDIFQVNFQTDAGNTLICIGNHWPSRSGGQAASEPYRQMAGETLSYWVERIKAITGPDTPVIVLGDFNDEPFDSSLADYALGERSPKKVISKRSKKPYLMNLMWEMMGQGHGTHYYDNWGMLDQILVNKPLLNKEGPFKLVKDSVAIIKTPQMLKSGKPRRFNRPSAKKGVDEAGYSDHLPIEVRVRED